LNNFFECPWKWYFRNLLGLPETATESLEFGNAVHACIDAILRMKKMPVKKELEEMVKVEISKREFSNKLDSELKKEKKQERIEKEVLGVVLKWVQSRLPEIKSNRENEKSISAKDDAFPHLNIYGKIDLLEFLDMKNVRVTDFKTGSVRKKSDIEKMDPEGRMSPYLRQLSMYSYLIKRSSRDTLEVTESRLEFLEAKDPKEAFYNRIISQKELDLLMKDISDYDTLVKKGEWIARPCNYNSYGKNTECEYCKLAEIYK
jgi:RecB family exonuclease